MQNFDVDHICTYTCNNLGFPYMDHYLVQRLQVVDPDCIFNLMDQFCNWMWLYQHRPNTWQNCYFDQWPPMLQQLGLDVFHWPKLYWTTWSSNYNIKIKTNLLKKKNFNSHFILDILYRNIQMDFWGILFSMVRVHHCSLT